MTLSPLLPIRHRQGDFFIADIFENLPFKDDVASMEHPLFSLTTKPDMRTLVYENGPAKIEVIPSSLGLPSIFDKDILLYCSSLFMAEINRGNHPPKTVRVSIHDFLVATQKKATGGEAYQRFKIGLDKLRGCTIKTTIKTGKVAQTKGFGYIDSYDFIESSRVKDRLVALEITFSDWLYNSLVAKEVLTIDPRYFLLRKSLDRRIYEIARKHCGRSVAWDISLEKLLLKTGSTARLKHFRDTIKKLAASNHLPEYLVSYNIDKDIVTFRYRGKARTGTEEQGEFFDTASTIPAQIPPDLLDDVRRVVGLELDYYDLWDQFISWSGSKKANNVRGGFIGFCKTKAAKS